MKYHRVTRGIALIALVAGIMISPLAARESGVLRYRGHWNSNDTGHSGPMRARLTPSQNGGYTAVFTGRFAKVIPFVYRTQLMPNSSGGYSTTKQLGPLLGEYRMQSFVNGSSFQANFQAAGDKGSFHLQRVR